MDASKWDKSAGDYQRIYRAGPNAYNKKLMDFLQAAGMVFPGCRVLDVGCGVGKYGSYFAALGCDITLMDISAEMLRRADENMRPYSGPWRTVLADFNSVSPDHPDLAGGFDLSISTMSPAIHDPATVEKLSTMTRGWCFVTNFVSWRQPLRDSFYTALGYDPAEAMAGGVIGDLEKTVRLAGYEPHLRYESYDWTDERSPREAAEYLIKRHPAMDENDPELLNWATAFADRLCDKDGVFRDSVFTRVAWLSWKTLD